MNLYGINYRACNMGSTYNNDNSETCKMANGNRFQYDFYPNIYTSIPCYIVGRTLSIWGDGYSFSDPGNTDEYYPAISTYVKFYYRIND